jgi:tetratricopeptide (TPR) repeat protein
LEFANDDAQAQLPKLKRAFAKRFRLGPLPDSVGSVPKELIHQLGIDRVITLNYDLEFEWLMMTTLEERARTTDRAGLFDRLRELGVIAHDPRTSGLTRVLPNGRSVLSDVFYRERTDRLIEFAVGSPDYEGHVLHLHGRATHPETMVVSLRDYNNQYRRSGVTKLPFEHALRILFAGNPILFVGVGMKEDEVTATLEQMVSDHPNRRIARAFILWNAPRGDRDALRFRWLHRFGVLTLFDDEILPDGESLATGPEARLLGSVGNLATSASAGIEPFPWQANDFRSIEAKLPEFDESRARCDSWATLGPPPLGPLVRLESLPNTDEAIRRRLKRDISRAERERDIAQEVGSQVAMRLFVGEPGSGKGALAQELREAWLARPAAYPGVKRVSCIINASFAFESDSIFSLISGLADGRPASVEGQSRAQSLLNYVQGGGEHKEILIVINGMERFFAPDGAPLSSELDMLLRRLIDLGTLVTTERQKEAQARAARGEPDPLDDDPPTRRSPWPYTIHMLGTARVQRYFSAFRGLSPEFFNDDPKFARRHLALTPDETRSHYFNALIAQIESLATGNLPISDTQRALIDAKAATDRNGVRRSVFAAYLQPELLRAVGVTHPDLALDIITLMAFIGSPVEDGVLFHAPRVQERLRGIDGDPRTAFRRTFNELSALSLIIGIAPFPETPASWRRYGLHRAMLTEMRDRLGVPLTDAQLSAGFNLTIFAAQPADGYTPEQDNHEELGRLVDWLCGAYHDQPLEGYATVAGAALGVPFAEWKRIAQTVLTSEGLPVDAYRRAWPHVAGCLRAALSLVRCYYSTSTLLSYNLDDTPPPPEQEAPLTQHADRLQRLISAVCANAVARQAVAEALGPLKDWREAAPFYPDDLVWLHNELGVVKLAQGNLYEARYAFNEAQRLNGKLVEFDDQGTNWRRIQLNQVHVDIERAQLERAEGRMRQIEESICHPRRETSDWLRRCISRKYGQHPVRDNAVVDDIYPHEVILTMGLIFGYRGLSLHLQGQLQAAEASFKICVNILDNIGERRSYSVFQRHYAALVAALRRWEAHQHEIRLALAAADATRQVDIAHHARIAAGWYARGTASASERAAHMRQLKRALSYGEVGDMHRVRVEAGLSLARIKMDGGDHDAALEHAADAMAIAVRYGLSLRKISLRIIIGQILVRRGDPVSGRALLERAIRNADRVNYQRAVEHAQNVLVEEPLG